MKDLNFQNLLRITVFLVFSIAVFYILIVGQKIIVPLLVSFFFAFLLLPMCRRLESWRFPRSLAAIVSLVAVLVVLSGVGFLFGSQVSRFVKDMDQISDKIAELKTSLPTEIEDGLNNFFNGGLVPFLEENITEIFTGLGAFASSATFAIVVPIYVVLILIYRDVFAAGVYMAVDMASGHLKHDTHVIPSTGGEYASIREVLPRIQTIVQKYIIGMFYVMCVLFVLNSAALLALGIEHALLFAAFAAVLNIIPFVGPLLGSTLPILFALVTKDSLLYPALVLAAFIVIQTAESNLITPNIVGRNVSLNPLTTLVTLFIGAAVWGVVGMILFIPLVAVLKEVMESIPGMQPFAYILGSGKQKRGKFWDSVESRVRNKVNR